MVPTSKESFSIETIRECDGNSTVGASTAGTCQKVVERYHLMVALVQVVRSNFPIGDAVNYTEDERGWVEIPLRIRRTGLSSTTETKPVTLDSVGSSVETPFGLVAACVWVSGLERSVCGRRRGSETPRRLHSCRSL
jgi:hypothetical protein